MVFRSLISIGACIGLIACGGGGTDSNANTRDPVLNPQVVLTASVNQAIVGMPYTLRWNLKDVSSCSLSGAIEQTVTNSGSVEIIPTLEGSQKTKITCETVSASVDVVVLPAFVEVPDPVFADALSRIGYRVNNGKMATSDALTIDKLCITSKTGSYGEPDSNNTAILSNTSVPDAGVRCAYTDGYITDPTGLDAFLNLRTIRLEHQQIKNIDLSKLKSLQFLSLWGEPITDINLKNNTELVTLGLSETSLTTVDTSSLIKLEEAGFQQGNEQLPYYIENGTLVKGFAKVDFSRNQSIKRVYLNYNPLSDLGVSSNSNSLRELWAYNTNVESLNLSGYKLLDHIILDNSPNLNHLNIYGVNNNNIPIRLSITNAPSLNEIIVNNKAAYTKALEGGKIYIDQRVNIVEGP